MIDQRALIPTAVPDDGLSVISQTAAVTGAGGALVHGVPGGNIIGIHTVDTLPPGTPVASNEGP